MATSITSTATNTFGVVAGGCVGFAFKQDSVYNVSWEENGLVMEMRLLLSFVGISRSHNIDSVIGLGLGLSRYISVRDAV
jgi:hypothetical protein